MRRELYLACVLLLAGCASMESHPLSESQRQAIWEQVGGAGPHPEIHIKPRAEFERVFGQICGTTIGRSVFISEDCSGEHGTLAAEFDHVIRAGQPRMTLECYGDRAAERVATRYGELGIVRNEQAAALRDCPAAGMRVE